jgi:hypothetical protein
MRETSHFVSTWLPFVAFVTNLTYVAAIAPLIRAFSASSRQTMTIHSATADDFSPREIWSVHDFARRHRLSKMEESRLKMLHGPYAAMRDLMASGKNTASGW